MQEANDMYSQDELLKIIKGYSMLERGGQLTSLFRKICSCNQCARSFPNRADLPINRLVRPLNLSKLLTNEAIRNYSVAIKRDDTLLRNLFRKNLTTSTIIKRSESAKFAIGLNPWLDRCMLFRKSRRTKLMIVGIDYKHLPAFCRNSQDHHFPLDSYRKKNNVWGPTWKTFWQNLLGRPYNDDSVNHFLKENGVFITNSMLCFGGNEDPQSHFYGYLECCRNHIARMIEIVKPEIIVSFGNLGCRNVASILLEGDQEDKLTVDLLKGPSPLRNMHSIVRRRKYKEGITTQFSSRRTVFWPLYQPAWSHLNRYEGGYKTLRRILNV